MTTGRNIYVYAGVSESESVGTYMWFYVGSRVGSKCSELRRMHAYTLNSMHVIYTIIHSMLRGCTWAYHTTRQHISSEIKVTGYSLLVKMDKSDNHVVIKYLQLKGLTTTAIRAYMVLTLGDDAPVSVTVQRWAAEFKRGRQSLEDDLRSERPSTAAPRKMFNKYTITMIVDDRQFTTRHTANREGISHERVANMVRHELGMKVSVLLTREAPGSSSPVRIYAARESNHRHSFPCAGALSTRQVSTYKYT